jgi:hypothetical protein
MGRWMQVVRRQAPQGHDGPDQVLDDLVLGEIAPHPLMHAFDAVCRANPGKREIIHKWFPTLDGIALGSTRYADEELWLNAAELGHLLEELRRLRRVCRREQRLPGIDGAASYAMWLGCDRPEDFDSWLDGIEAMLAEASASGYRVRLVL